MNLHTSDSDKIEITRATNPESRVRSSCHFFYYDTQKPRSGVRRGAPAEPWRVSQNPESEADGTWQVHMVPDPGSAIRSDRGKPPRRTQSPGSRLRTPASCPPAVRCAETRVQSPEGTTGAQERGANPRAGSRVRPPEARPRQQGEGRDPGSKVRLSGEGAARGRIQRGREGEAGLRGSLVLMKNPRK